MRSKKVNNQRNLINRCRSKQMMSNYKIIIKNNRYKVIKHYKRNSRSKIRHFHNNHIHCKVKIKVISLMLLVSLKILIIPQALTWRTTSKVFLYHFHLILSQIFSGKIMTTRCLTSGQIQNTHHFPINCL